MKTWTSLLLLVSTSAFAHPTFTDSECSKISTLWNSSGSYVVEDATKSPTHQQIGQTVEGSKWLLTFRNLLLKGHLSDGTLISKQSKKDWNRCVNDKIASDQKALSTGRNSDDSEDTTASASESNLIPKELEQELGAAPVFAKLILPKRYIVRFPDGEVYKYQDHVKMPGQSPFFRSENGVMSNGSLSKADRDKQYEELFHSANLSQCQIKVLRKVSQLEGNFSSINTYDIGGVSVGFIQFAALQSGRGSLSKVLAEEKTINPSAFNRDFHRWGVDVTDDGALCVVDLGNSSESIGQEAVAEVVNDKRLTAVFERAGRRSEAFRSAQLAIALKNYWPQNDEIIVKLSPDVVCKGRVCDVIHSEAGYATLFDRKVNLGNLKAFCAKLSQIMVRENISDFSKAATYEHEIIASLKFRADYLSDSSLTQPSQNLASDYKVDPELDKQVPEKVE